MSEIQIAGRKIGSAHPPYVIAELSANHNGRIEAAFEVIEAAKVAGADAVKIQTYTPATRPSNHDGPGFRIQGGLWDGMLLHELYGRAQTPWEWHERLFAHAQEVGITLFSTPFDDTAVDLLVSLGAPAMKVASFEAMDTGLLRKIARTGLPSIISTGMVGLGEIEDALSVFSQEGAPTPVLLHCVSEYPAQAASANLRTIPHMREGFGAIVGLSDHTLSSAVAVAAVAHGAAVIEKHVTLRRSDGGPDAAFSIEPHELAELVKQLRDAWDAAGEVRYNADAKYRGNAVFRRSLYVVEDVLEGEELTHKNVRSIRPGFGLPPKYIGEVLGRRAVRNLRRGEPLVWSMIG